jgi:hypothetical protein
MEPVRKEDEFWRKFALPEEDRLLLDPGYTWAGIRYRWFRSPNVVPIEQWRRRRAREGRPAKNEPAPAA